MRLYRNKKKGTIYKFHSFATDCTNSRDGQTVVIYHPENNNLTLYIRDEKEFFEKFEEVK